MARHEDNYKMVAMPIRVPAGHFCFDDLACCGHFNNDGGHPTCTVGFYPLDYNEQGYVSKPRGCLWLKKLGDVE